MPAPLHASTLRKTRASPKKSPVLKDNPFSTTAFTRCFFLVCDPSGQFETGDPIVWENQLVLRSNLTDDAGQRRVALFVAPHGDIRYTLDASEPRDGTPYNEPIAIGDDKALLRAFATADGLEVKRDFSFQPAGKKGVDIDDAKPARLVSRSIHKLDSRDATFEALKAGGEQHCRVRERDTHCRPRCRDRVHHDRSGACRLSLPHPVAQERGRQNSRPTRP